MIHARPIRCKLLKIKASLFTKHPFPPKRQNVKSYFSSFYWLKPNVIYLQKSVFFLFYPFFLLPMSLKTFLFLPGLLFPISQTPGFWSISLFSMCSIPLALNYLYRSPNITRLWYCWQVTPLFKSSPQWKLRIWVLLFLFPSPPIYPPFLFSSHSFPNSHSLSFNYIFWMKESKSASLDSIILKHWYHNLNFLLDCSNRICHWLLKLNTSKITLLSPTFKPFFYSFASFFIHACLAKSTSEMSGSYPFLEFPLPPWN